MLVRVLKDVEFRVIGKVVALASKFFRCVVPLAASCCT